MRICRVTDLEPGMVLGKSIFSEAGELLLRSGYEIDGPILQRIRATGRLSVYVFEEGTEDIIPEEVLTEEVRGTASAAITSQIKNVGQVFKDLSVEPQELKEAISSGAEFENVVNVAAVSDEVSSIVDEIMASSSGLLNQSALKSSRSYLQDHAIDVAVLCILIGRKLNYKRRELVELGMGAFMHDIGKVAFPQLLAKRPSELTEDEHFVLREHPVFGQLMLARSTESFVLAQAAVLYHHERQDGLGYPLGVRGRNQLPYLNGTLPTVAIFPLAEIIAVADAYDNFISGRGLRDMCPAEAVTEIIRNQRTVYNVEVVRILGEVVCVFPTGATVRIAECSNKSLEGCVAAIMKPAQDRPHHPLVVLLRDRMNKKIIPRTVDLGRETLSRLELVG
jgi:HD-GYP domain-containing protein (c-di-GMP phosphodiesterase class II)